MSEPRVLATFADYDGLIEALRQRKTDLGLSCLLMDELSGLPAGYTAKVLGPSRIKSLGAISTSAINGCLAIKLAVIEDLEAIQRMAGRWERRDEGHVRPISPPPNRNPTQNGDCHALQSRRILRECRQLC